MLDYNALRKRDADLIDSQKKENERREKELKAYQDEHKATAVEPVQDVSSPSFFDRVVSLSGNAPKYRLAATSESKEDGSVQSANSGIEKIEKAEPSLHYDGTDITPAVLREVNGKLSSMPPAQKNNVLKSEEYRRFVNGVANVSDLKKIGLYTGNLSEQQFRPMPDGVKVFDSQEAFEADKIVREKYGYDPDTFNSDDLREWAKNHGFMYTVWSKPQQMYLDATQVFGTVNDYLRYDPLKNKDDVQEYINLIALARNNDRKSQGAVETFVGSTVNSALMGLPSAASDVIDSQHTQFIPKSEQVRWSDVQSAHPISSAAGDIVGSVLSLRAVGAIAHDLMPWNIAGNVEKFNNIPQSVKRAVETAATFGAHTAIESSARQDWTNDPKKSAKMVVEDTITSAIGGYFGSAVSGKVSQAVYNRLGGYNLSRRAATAIASGVGASAFSAVSSGSQEAKNAIRAKSEGTEYNPNIKGIATNILVTGLYSALSGYAFYQPPKPSSEKQRTHEHFSEEDVRDMETLQRKYRQYAKELHPDLHPNQSAEEAELFKIITDEYNYFVTSLKSNTVSAFARAAETGSDVSDKDIKNAVTIIETAVGNDADIQTPVNKVAVPVDIRDKVERFLRGKDNAKDREAFKSQEARDYFAARTGREIAGDRIGNMIEQAREIRDDIKQRDIQINVEMRMNEVRNDPALTTEEKKARREEIVREVTKAADNGWTTSESAMEAPVETAEAQEVTDEADETAPQVDEVAPQVDESATQAEEATTQAEETAPQAETAESENKQKIIDDGSHRLTPAQTRDFLKNDNIIWMENDDGQRFIGNGYYLIRANKADVDTLIQNASAISQVDGERAKNLFSAINEKDISVVSLVKKSDIDGLRGDGYIVETASGERMLFNKKFVDVLNINGGKLKTDDSKQRLLSYDENGDINGIVAAIKPTSVMQDAINAAKLKSAKGFTVKNGGVYIDKYQQKTFADVKNKTSLGSYLNEHIGETIYVNGEKRTIGSLSRGELVTVKPDGTKVYATLKGSSISFQDNGFTVTFDNGVTTVFSFDEPKTESKNIETQSKSVEKAEEKVYNDTETTKNTNAEVEQDAGQLRDAEEPVEQVPDRSGNGGRISGGRSIQGVGESEQAGSAVETDRGSRGRSVSESVRNDGGTQSGGGSGLRVGSESGNSKGSDTSLSGTDRVSAAEGNSMVGTADDGGRRGLTETVEEKPAEEPVSERETKSEAGEDTSVVENEESKTPDADSEEKPAEAEKKPSKTKKSNNYQLSETIDDVRPNFSDNVKALKLLKELQRSGRLPTPEEKDVLAKYKGWGALKKEVFGVEDGGYYANQIKQLLTDDEYKAAKFSAQNAHYTSTKVIDGIYKMVERLGFTGGNVLEPSMGVGNFFGRLPKKLSSSVNLYGVELDSVTGAIAQYLYPDANISISGFQDVLYPDGTFDLAIGNVPFSDMTLEYRGKKYMLHDFFFVKTLDEMKEGGIVAMLTSTGTMDKQNGKTVYEIGKRANLIAAFRLPDNAFKVNAGTSVTTDLIILQKKGASIPDNGVEFGKVGAINNIPINEYYVNHPDHILGELVYEKGMYQTERAQVRATADFEKRFEAAIRSLPKGYLSQNAEAPAASSSEIAATIRGRKERNVFRKGSNGNIDVQDKKTGEIITLNDKQAQIAGDYMRVKDAYFDVVEAEKVGDLGKAEQYRRLLNKEYDAFQKKHGSLFKQKRLLSNDDDYIRMSGLEIVKVNKDKTTSIVKSQIFSQPTIAKSAPVTAKNAQDALVISLNYKGGVDFEYMKELTGLSEEKLINDLGDKIILTPDGEYVLIQQYVSGNIYDKLDAVKGREGFEHQQELLEKALPKRKGASEIQATLGAPWIDADYIAEFAETAYNLRFKPDIGFSKELGSWKVDRIWTSNKKFSTSRVSPSDMLEATLNGKNVQVRDKMPDGSYVVNQDKTIEAQQAQQELREAFENWIFKDKERRDTLVEKFNRLFNAYAPMDYSSLAKSLDMEIAPTSSIKPRDYQAAAVARILFGGNTLLAHGVGTGKTSTMIMAAHMLKKTGIVKKPLFDVPNGKVNDFRNEILGMYPDANILALDDKMMTPTELSYTKALISTGDYDYVLIYHSAFEKLAVSPQTQAAFIEKRLDELESAKREEADRVGRHGVRFEKILTNKLKAQKEKLEKILKNAKSEDVFFEDLGVDAIFVDEAHNYKKVGFETSMMISGIDSSTNNRTTDLYMKEDYIRDHGGRIVFGTATPLTNTLSEMYNMTLHLAPEIYDRIGIRAFDAFASNFLTIEEQPEIAPDGVNYRLKERVRSFKNPNELIGLFRQFADVVHTKDVVKDLPQAEYSDVVSPKNQFIADVVQRLAKRAENKTPEDNMLKITTDGKMAALDLRLVSFMFPDIPVEQLDLPDSKINRAVGNIIDVYHNTSASKGTQFVFLDDGINDNGKRYNFNLYQDLKEKLIKGGIKKTEIAFIGDYDGESKREFLYDAMNSGEIRVLIGSTAKMGEGVNAQKKAAALHHISVPWRPDNIEQREGRVIRFGNENKNVKIFRYVQEGSFDSYMWQMLERKAKFIAQAMNGGDAMGLEELDDFVLTAGELKAEATGNPIIKEKMEVDTKVNKLRSLKRSYNNKVYDAQETVEKAPAQIKELESWLALAKDDADFAEGKKDSDFSIKIGKNVFDKRKDAGNALMPLLKKLVLSPYGTRTVIGEYNGFTLYAQHEYGSTVEDGIYFELSRKLTYSTPAGGSEEGNIARVINLFENGIQTKKQSSEIELHNAKSALEEAEEILKTPFKQEDEFQEAIKRQLEINRELGISGKGVVDFSDAVPEGTGESNESGDNIQKFIGDGSGRTTRWSADKNEGNEERIKPLSTIIRDFSKRTGIPIHVGNYRGKQIGQFNATTESIRTKAANDLPTVSHELGHYLDKAHNLTDSPYIQEAIDMLSDKFKAKYKKDEIPSEAVAEFVRKYLKSKSNARSLAPNFYDDFCSRLGSDIGMVNDFASEVNAYMSAGSEERFRAAIKTQKQVNQENKEHLSEKSKRIGTALYKALIDKNVGIRNALEEFDQYEREAGTKNAYILATNAAQAAKRAERLITYRLYDMNAKEEIGKSFVERIAPVFKHREAFSEYLVLNHALEWMEPNDDEVAPKKVFGDPYLENTDLIRERLEELKEKFPEFEKAAEDVYDFIDKVMYEYGVKSGVLSKDLYHRLRMLYPHYVPFQRDVESQNTGNKARRSFANQGLPFKRAKGSGYDILDPVEQIVNMTNKIVVGALRNQVCLALADTADATEGFAAIMEKVSPDMLPHIVNITRQKKNMHEKLDELLAGDGVVDDISKAFEEIFGDNVVDFTPYADKNKGIVTFRRNGKNVYYQVNDKDVYSALVNLSPAQFNGAMQLLRTVGWYFKGMVTSYNPLFMIKNMARDFGTAWYNTDENNFARFVKDYFVALKEIVGKPFVGESEMYRQYKALGGGDTSQLNAIRGDINRSLGELVAKGQSNIAQKIVGRLLHPIHTIGDAITLPNNVIEQIPRYAEFMRQMKKTGDVHTAFYEAQDATVNFYRRGDRTREVDAVFPFTGAQMQGIDRVVRSFTDASGKQKTARFMKYILTGLLLEAALFYWNRREDKEKEQYENLSAYTKNNYYVFSLGNGRYIKIAKPREQAILSSTIGRLAEYVFGNDNAFYNFGEYVWSEIMPKFLPSDFRSIDTAVHSVLSNTLLGGIVDIGFNMDYKGDPILSKYDVYLEDKSLAYSDSTSKLAIALGKALNYEPKKIDYLINNYAGYTGKIIKALFPNNPSYRDVSLGFKGSLSADSRYSTDIFNIMYDKAEKASNKVQDEKQSKGKASSKSLADMEISNLLSTEYSQYKKAIRNTLTDDKEKRDATYIMQQIAKNYDYSPSDGMKFAMELYDRTENDDLFLSQIPINQEYSYSTTGKNKQKYAVSLTPEQYLSLCSEFEHGLEAIRLEMKNAKADDEKLIDYFGKKKKELISDLKARYALMYGKPATE